MGSVKEKVVSELHKPARKNFRRRRVLIRGLNDLLQADLVEMIPYANLNKGYRYILMVINAFSKYAYAEPVKRKTAADVTAAMKKVLSQMKIIPKNVQTDNGKEFYNKDFKNLMESHKINHYSSFSNTKASIVERLNRTIKNLMWRQFSLQGSYRWLSILPIIIKSYNTTKHSTLSMKPIEVNSKNEKKLLKSVYGHLKTLDPKGVKFFPGDFVRISKYREAFRKGYKPSWSNEIFLVKKIIYSNPTTYILKDKNGVDIQGAFYREELQKTQYPDIYLIEKILRRKGNKVYVKWLGLDKKNNSWINKSDLL